MYWVRALPVELARGQELPGRTFISDAATSLVYMDKDYRQVLDQLTDSAVILEWDIAVSCESRAFFQREVEAQPDRVRVAPYRLYPTSTGLQAPVWAHRRVEAPGHYRWVRAGESDCDLFGLGMTYLPLQLAREALVGIDGPITDTTLSQWHHSRGYGPVPISWGQRPIHLHYSARDVSAHYAALAAWHS